jgi:predicted Holliday junction resolvase-like endonuclease
MPIPLAMRTIGSWFAHNKILTGSVITIMWIIMFLGAGYIHIQNLQSEIVNQNKEIEELSQDIIRQNQAIRALAEQQERELEQSKMRVGEELRRQESIKGERTNINNAEELNEWLSNL